MTWTSSDALEWAVTCHHRPGRRFSFRVSISARGRLWSGEGRDVTDAIMALRNVVNEDESPEARDVAPTVAGLAEGVVSSEERWDS